MQVTIEVIDGLIAERQQDHARTLAKIDELMQDKFRIEGAVVQLRQMREALTDAEKSA